MTTDPIAEANRKVAEHRRLRIEDLLRDCAEYLERHEDVIDGSDGRPVANAAMWLRARIISELAA